MIRLTNKEIKDELLNLLIKFDEFCTEQDLSYSLYGGTLLGAIRHNGFIPWDDDIDLCMPRPDYDRLLGLEDEIPAGYGLMTGSNSSFASPFIKFVNKAIRAQESAYEGTLKEYLWLDILPVDGEDSASPDWKKRQLRIKRIIKRKERLTLNPLKSSKSKLKGIAKIPYILFLSFISPVSKLDSIIQNESLRFDFETSGSITVYPSDIKGAWYLDKNRFLDYTLVSFEGRKFPAMGCWDDYLKLAYNDYMTLPPEHARINHELDVWREG